MLGIRGIIINRYNRHLGRCNRYNAFCQGIQNIVRSRDSREIDHCNLMSAFCGEDKTRESYKHKRKAFDMVSLCWRRTCWGVGVMQGQWLDDKEKVFQEEEQHE